MNFDDLLIGIVVAYLAWRVFGAVRVRRRLPELKREGAQLVDVRSVGEYAGGHVPGTLNIPLQELDARATELDPSRWVIVACASGTRSAISAERGDDMRPVQARSADGVTPVHSNRFARDEVRCR